MEPRLLALSDLLYGGLLHAYPAAFRERFAIEMLQVFRCLSRQVYADSGAPGLLHLWLLAAWDWFLGMLAQWWVRLTRRRMENMQATTDFRDGIQPLSSTQALIAALPFLGFGLSSLVSKLEYFRVGPASLPLWLVLLITPYLIFNWATLIGLGAGLYLGFPRWAFSYLGWALLYVWWWSDMGFYGYHMDWKIWYPLLAVFVICLALRRSWQPLRSMFDGIWRDWTLLSLAIYILYAHVYMLFDENHHPYLLLLIAATTLALSAGAWAYFRSASPMRRVLWLMGGLLVAAGLSALSYATWDYRAYYGLPESTGRVNLIGIIFPAVLALILLANGLLARWRLRRRAR